MNFVSLLSGVVKLFNLIAGWLRDKELVDTGKDLRQGELDAATIKNIKDAIDAKHGDNADLDDELRIEHKAGRPHHRRNMHDLLKK